MKFIHILIFTPSSWIIALKRRFRIHTSLSKISLCPCILHRTYRGCMYIMFASANVCIPCNHYVVCAHFGPYPLLFLLNRSSEEGTFVRGDSGSMQAWVRSRYIHAYYMEPIEAVCFLCLQVHLSMCIPYPNCNHVVCTYFDPHPPPLES